jgi:hypothetical protein
MTTTSVSHSAKQVDNSEGLISFEQAMEKMSREDRFRATVYAMNTLLVQKGIYSPEEFEFQFRQFAQKDLSKSELLPVAAKRAERGF